jgi:hypothetical protein
MPTHTNHHSRIITYTMLERNGRYLPQAMHGTTVGNATTETPKHAPLDTKEKSGDGPSGTEHCGLKDTTPGAQEPIDRGRKPSTGGQATTSRGTRRPPPHYSQAPSHISQHPRTYRACPGGHCT